MYTIPPSTMSANSANTYKPLEDRIKDEKFLEFLRELFEGGCVFATENDRVITISLSDNTVKFTRDCTIEQLPAIGDYTIELRRGTVSFPEYVEAVEAEHNGLTAEQQNDATFVSPVVLKLLGTPRLMQLDCKSECIVWLAHQFSKLTPIPDA